MVIILMAIGAYYINGYWWFWMTICGYYILLVAISGYSILLVAIDALLQNVGAIH